MEHNLHFYNYEYTTIYLSKVQWIADQCSDFPDIFLSSCWVPMLLDLQAFCSEAFSNISDDYGPEKKLYVNLSDY